MWWKPYCTIQQLGNESHIYHSFIQISPLFQSQRVSYTALEHPVCRHHIQNLRVTARRERQNHIVSEPDIEPGLSPATDSQVLEVAQAVVKRDSEVGQSAISCAHQCNDWPMCFCSPNSVVNTWGSYGSGKRSGFTSEVADTIRRNFRGFVLECAFSHTFGRPRAA